MNTRAMDTIATMTAADRWTAWDVLKLELFTPVRLSKDQRAAIDAETRNIALGALRHDAAMMRLSPVALAVLKPQTIDTVSRVAAALPYAQNIDIDMNRPACRPDTTADFLHRQILNDVQKISACLLGDPRIRSSLRIGYFRSQETPYLHRDGLDAVFVMRALALPMEVVRPADERREPMLAGLTGALRDPAAIRELRDNHVLKPLLLNMLYWMPSRDEDGVLHGSGPVPQRKNGVPSMIYTAIPENKLIRAIP